MARISKADRQIIAELERRTAGMQAAVRKPIQRAKLGFEKTVSDPQRAFLDDTSRKVLACTGRRAGKTFGIVIKMLSVCLSKENAFCWYITPSRPRSKEICWGLLVATCHQYLKPYQYKIHEGELSITFSTKSTIKLTGVYDLFDANKIRGVPTDLWAIDEASTFRDGVLEELIDQGIEPASREFPDAQIVLAGTPTTKRGYLYKKDKRNDINSAWSCHSWNVLANPFYNPWRGKDNWQELALEYLAEERKENGWSIDNGAYQRECLGNWAGGDSERYYSSFEPVRNVIDPSDIPADLRYVIGCDFALRRDNTAMVVLGYNPDVDRNCYVVDLRFIPAPTNMIHICLTLKKLMDKYQPEATVGDSAGVGAAVFQAMYERYKVDVDDADKYGKSDKSDVINAELHEGRIKVASHLTELIQELQTIEWDAKRNKPDPAFQNDVCDAMQYGYSSVRNFLYKPPEPQKTRQQIQNEELEAYFAEEDLRIQQEQDTWQF